MWIIIDKIGAIDTSKVTALTIENSAERIFNFASRDRDSRFSTNLFEVTAHMGATQVPIKKFNNIPDAMEYIKDLVTSEDW